MLSSEWQRIEEIFHAALRLQAVERSAYLTDECRGDERLRHEVESLLEASEQNGTFIDRPALSLGLKLLSNVGPQFSAGQSIGHYRIIRPLGSGGMGVVYLAEDSTLERKVALKFLAGGFQDDTWAKDQLQNEARAVAKLENANICVVHNVEEIDEANFIVMQYVEGETLASLLRHEYLSLDRVLDFAEQTVSALADAHLHGIIHRDIKPQNIIVTPERRIKVLDFGLAKFVKRQVEEPVVDQAAQPGFVMGTVAYMSPEQITGEELDGGSDIFSFGIVLYEMLAGSHPFVRESKEETLNAIRYQEPPPLPHGVPPQLVSMVRHCLAKDREKRFESTEDLLTTLQRIREQRRPATGLFQMVRRHRHFNRYVLVALFLFICAVVTAGFLYQSVSRVHTLAVVPIANHTGESGLDILKVGLTKNISDKLSYLPKLKVKSPSEVPSNETESILRAGRELDVEAVLYGEILKEGDSLLLHLRVLNSADGKVRLEQTFYIDQTNLLALEDEIASRVTTGLGVWLIGSDRELLHKRQTSNQAALNAYMKGRFYWSQKRNEENLKEAIKFFSQAIEQDPAYAKAYAGRADCHILMTNVLYGLQPVHEATEKALHDAGEALKIDPLLAEGHVSMGIIKFRYNWDWQEAERELKLAMELDPQYAPAHFWYSNVLAVMGRFDESVRESEKGRSLDPYSPLSAMNYARSLYYAGRYNEAANFLRKKLDELEDKKAVPQYWHLLGYVLLQQGKPHEAITKLETLFTFKPKLAAAALGYAYGKTGKYEDAKRMLAFLEDSKDPIPPHEKAIIYMGMNDLDQAFAFLQQSYESRFASIAFLTTDPLYADLRADPRFNELARKANLRP
jgi:serine/threonine protein kinase/Flp pilus assembly protein TadD